MERIAYELHERQWLGIKWVREIIPNRHYQNILMKRWGVRCRWGSILLHKFESSDDTTLGLHDHPWHFFTIILWRGYDELTPGGGCVRRRPGSITFRRATTLHAVRLLDAKPSWSLCLCGPKIRAWGFQTAEGWVAERDIDGGAGHAGRHRKGGT